MLSIDSSTTICNYHITTLITMYQLQRKCCDPFSNKKVCCGNLRIISIKFVEKANTVDINLTPGKKYVAIVKQKYQLIEQDTTEIELTENEDVENIEDEIILQGSDVNC